MPSPNNIEVVKTDGKLTDEDLKNLKQVAQYWNSGKIFLVVICTLGLFATVAVNVFDAFSKWVHH